MIGFCKIRVVGEESIRYLTFLQRQAPQQGGGSEKKAEAGGEGGRKKESSRNMEGFRWRVKLDVIENRRRKTR